MNALDRLEDFELQYKTHKSTNSKTIKKEETINNKACVFCDSTEDIELAHKIVSPIYMTFFSPKDYLCKECSKAYKSPDLSTIEADEIQIDAELQQCREKLIQYKEKVEQEEKEKANKLKEQQEFKMPIIESPQAFKQQLDEYVIGQEETKKILSVAIYIHCKKVELNSTDFEKTNILLIGNTGVGKTYLIKTISKLLDVPFVSIPSTQITKTGWSGVNISAIIRQLIIRADYNIEKAKRGIIYIDEIDKLGNRHEATNGSLPNLDTQSDLLTFIEGTEVILNTDVRTSFLNTNKEPLLPDTFDTTNVLFICGGSFAEMLKKKQKTEKKIGFGSNLVDETANPLQNITVSDLEEAGLITELIGRLQIRCVLDALDKEAYKKIILNAKNSVYNQWKDFLQKDNIKLTITDGAIDLIAEKCEDLKVGARGIKSIIDKILYNELFNITKETKSINITKKMIERITKLL